MNDYEQQAQKFLTATKSTLAVRWLKYDLYFPSDKEKRDIFEVKLSRGSRNYVFTFGNSIEDHEKMLKSFFRFENPQYAQQAIDEYMAKKWIHSFDSTINAGIRNWKKAIQEMKEWKNAGENFRPSAYNILARLEGNFYTNNVDDFAAEYGYEKPSEALKTFEAVKKQAEELQKLYNDDELNQLSEIA